MSRESVPAPPEGTSAAGERLWRSVVDAFELDEHELALLVEAVRTVDLLEELDALVRAEGPVVDSPQGMKPHPAGTEARQQRIVLARLIAALRLPAGEEGDQQMSARPRRSGPRGVHAVRSA
jgi:hypothetical protein